jgi:hypothetical protein
MKIRTLLLTTLFFCIFVISGSRLCYSESSSPEGAVKAVNSSFEDITYQRVKIDGVWWIYVYQDGVKVQQYIDPDQSDH